MSYSNPLHHQKFLNASTPSEDDYESIPFISPFYCSLCGDPFSSLRASLGYSTCLKCGEKEASQVVHTVLPMNKSNYVYVSPDDPHNFKSSLNPKKTI